jgi:hypothetical protein
MSAAASAGRFSPAGYPSRTDRRRRCLLHHLSALHPVDIKPYLVRMETQCIDAVVMELFERVQASDQRS